MRSDLACYRPASLPRSALRGYNGGVTLLLQFEKPAPDRVLTEVKRELNEIMKDAGISFDLRLFT